MSRVAKAGLWFALLAAGCQPAAAPDADEGLKGGKAMQLTSAAFNEGGTIPKEYTADGRDVSPPLKWSGVPDGVKSFALIGDDPDAPRGTWVHWVLYNLPADGRELPEGVPAQDTLDNGAKQGTNDFHKVGYGGPSPPPGKPHRYFFKLYALDTTVDLKAGATKAQLVGAMKGHVLGEGELIGKYGR
jgi:Raf kinase inhibitor-like YbhB/YbcL family protein